MPTVFVHGAFASRNSFNYYRNFYPMHKDDVLIEYDAIDGLENNINMISDICIEKYKNNKFNIIGHSMGGIISVALLQHKLNINKIVTISSPFSGSKSATLYSYFMPGHRILKDISHKSKILEFIRNYKHNIPILNIITESTGSPFFREPNDGVVSVLSQVSYPYGEKYYVNLNHMEVLLSYDVIQKIVSFLE